MVETVCLTFQLLINALGLRSRGDISHGLVPTGGTCPFAQEDLLLTLMLEGDTHHNTVSSREIVKGPIA